MASTAPLYLAYLVRLRRENAAQEWLITVKQVGTEAQWQFASMDALYLFFDRSAHSDTDDSSEERGSE